MSQEIISSTEFDGRISILQDISPFPLNVSSDKKKQRGKKKDADIDNN